MNKALVLLFLFFIGSLIGWVIELFFRRFCSPNGRTTKKWVNPGFLVGPYLPLYGSGLCVLYMLASINLSFLDEHPIIEKIVLFVFMAIAMTVIEYITECKTMGLHRPMGQYSGNHLSTVFILLGSSRRDLLPADPSTCFIST